MDSFRKVLNLSFRGKSADKEKLIKSEKEEKNSKMHSNQYNSHSFSVNIQGRSSNVSYQRLNDEINRTKDKSGSNSRR